MEKIVCALLFICMIHFAIDCPCHSDRSTMYQKKGKIYIYISLNYSLALPSQHLITHNKGFYKNVIFFTFGNGGRADTN